MTKTMVLFAAFLAMGGGAGAQGHSHGGAMAPPAAPKSVQPPKVMTDLDFIDLTATRTQAALQLSRLAGQKAQDPQLRALAVEVSQALQRDVDYLPRLRGLLPNGQRAAAMAGMNSPAHTGSGGEHAMGDGATGSGPPSPLRANETVETTGQLDRLAALSGPEFDRTVAAAIIEHYQVTLPAAERAATDATRDEVRAFARASAAAQKKVIADLGPFAGSVR